MGGLQEGRYVEGTESVYLAGLLAILTCTLLMAVRFIRRRTFSSHDPGSAAEDSGCVVVCCKKDAQTSTTALEDEYIPEEGVAGTCIIYECDKLKCMCDVCLKDTRLLFNAIYTLRMYTTRVSDEPVAHVKWVLTTVPVDIFNVWNALSEDGDPIWLNYNARLIKLFIVATQDTACIFGNVLQTLCDKHLTAKNHGLIRHYLFCAYGSRHRLLFTRPSVYKTLPEDLQEWIDSVCSQPHTLQHLCRLAIRKHLRKNVYNGASKLIIPRCYQRFLCFEDDLNTKVSLWIKCVDINLYHTKPLYVLVSYSYTFEQLYI